MDRVSQPVPDATSFESYCLNRYEKSRIRRHVALTIVTMLMPAVPDYTVTFISILSSAVPDTQNAVFDLVLRLFQTNEDATSKSMFHKPRRAICAGDQKQSTCTNHDAI